MRSCPSSWTRKLLISLTAVDAARVREPIARLRVTLLLMLPVILLISVSAGYWLAGRSLLPILQVTNGLAGIKPRELHRRLAVPSRDAEVARLIAAINALLERIERASEAERRFATDAAHELRTPLTLLRSGIELALNRPRTAETMPRRSGLRSAIRSHWARWRMNCWRWPGLIRSSQLETEPIAWTALIKDVIGATEPVAQAKNISAAPGTSAAHDDRGKSQSSAALA